MATRRSPHGVWPEPSRRVTSRLRPEETLVASTRRHWIMPAEAIASTLAAVALVVLVDDTLGPSGEPLVRFLWFGVVLVAGRALWRWLEWRVGWFVATNERLMLSYGLVTRNLAMMPLGKVTDMRYVQSPWGRVLGYGEFVFESAGQDQAMHDVTLLPRSNQLYDAIYDQIARRERLWRTGRSSGGRRQTGAAETEVLAPGPIQPLRRRAPVGTEQQERTDVAPEPWTDAQLPEPEVRDERTTTHRHRSFRAAWRTFRGGDGERK